MDRLPDGNDGFANTNMFADSQQFNAYDNLNLFQNGSDSNFNDAGWGVNASDFPSNNPAVSRGHQPVSGWHGAHLSTSPAQASFDGQSSPYGRAINQSPVSFAQNGFVNYGGGQSGNFPYPQQQQHQQQQQQHQQRSTSTQPQPQQTQLPKHQAQQARSQQQQQVYDPSLVQPSSVAQNFNAGHGAFSSSTPTVAPQSLDNSRQQSQYAAAAFAGPTYSPSNFPPPRQNAVASSVPRVPVADQQTLISSMPRGVEAGIFSIINFDDLSRETNSERMGNFLNISKQALDWNVTRSAIPAYMVRKSRNELRRIAGANESVLAKIGKGSSKTKSRSALSKPAKLRQTQTSTPGENEIKYEQASSSESEDSSDDESSYSEDSDADSPLPAKRPDSLKGSIEYDTVKALWRSKRKAVDGETIRKALVDFWEIVKTIRDRWKADAAAVAEAEEKKRTGELPLLKSRVKDQRDMIEAAFRAALKHGHRAIVELLAENVSLLFVCYQFLLDRFKEDDVNGGVSRAILETMSTFTTLSESKLEKTHIAKVLPRYQKKGDAKTQYWVKKIQANVELATKAASAKSSTSQGEAKKPSAASVDPNKPASPSTKRVGTESVTGVKRAANTTIEGAAAKKLAVGSSKPAAATAAASVKVSGPVKKTTTTAPAKPTAGTTTVPAAKKTVVAKPSGYFSNLQSASKKPGTAIADKSTAATNSRPTIGKGAPNPSNATPKPVFSFAETMANLSKPKEEKPAPKAEKVTPPETPEARAKRLRKEERRKLHVVFKSGEDLVQIRYFVHHPEEEIDHDSSQMRDVADVGGEGRMFKQQQHMMDMDEDDEGADEDEKLIDFQTASNIDFSVVPEEERARNFAPFGGGEQKLDSKEYAIRESHENDTLMVVYTHPSEIPDNPREPGQTYDGADAEALTYFGDLDDKEKYILRASAKLAARQNRSSTHAFGQSSSNGFHYGQQASQASHTSSSTGPDIGAILAKLRQSASSQPSFTPPQPALSQPSYTAAYPTPQPAAAPPPQTQAQPASLANGLESIDLAAILAQLNGGNSNNNNNGSNQAQAGIAGQPPTMMMGAAPQTAQSSMFGSAGGSTQEGGEDIARIRAANPFYKTKACRFWQEGRCQKGTSCSYLHE